MQLFNTAYRTKLRTVIWGKNACIIKKLLALKQEHDRIIALNARSTLSASSQHFLLALKEFICMATCPRFVCLNLKQNRGNLNFATRHETPV
jgi:hypothetical protein